MYKLIIDPVTNQNGCIIRLSDNTCIPFEPANTDYQEYLKWIQEGGKVIDNPPSDTSSE